MSSCRLMLIAGLLWSLCHATAGAQGTNVPPRLPTSVPTVPGFPNGGPNLPTPPNMTPQQAQQYWKLRALQARGGGGGAPQRGFPMIVGGGMPTIGPPVLQPAPTTGNSAKPTAAQRRAQARAQLEERKRQAREEAEQKKKQPAAAVK